MTYPEWLPNPSLGLSRDGKCFALTTTTNPNRRYRLYQDLTSILIRETAKWRQQSSYQLSFGADIPGKLAWSLNGLDLAYASELRVTYIRRSRQSLTTLDGTLSSVG